jgi:hypothetical protein
MADTPTFASPWDEALLHHGPPTLFTLDPKGFVRADPERTREIFLLVGTPEGREIGHYVLTDRVTGLRMYALVNHPLLATAQPRADVARFPDYASAVAETVQQWAVPAPQALDGADEEP